MHLQDPLLPPLFSGHAVKAPATAQREACRGAAAGTLGAADLVWSRTVQRAACALILEPDVPLGRACQMTALGLVAVAETLGVLCPPQVSVQFRWPSSVLVNGGVAGAVTLAAPASAVADRVPAWLVLGVDVSINGDARSGEPGARPHETCLTEEGAGNITRTAFIEALAPRLLAWLHSWQEDGFRRIHAQWLFRAEGRDGPVLVDGRHLRVLGLDEDGNLIAKSADAAPEMLPYLPHLERAP